MTGMKRLGLHPVRQFFSRCEGVTTLELALLLVLLVCASYLACSLLGSTSRESFAAVAQAVGEPSRGPAAGSAGFQASSRNAQAFDSGLTTTRRPWHGLTVVGVFVLGSVVLFGMRWLVRRRDQFADSPETVALAAAFHRHYGEKRQQILRMLVGHNSRRPGQSVEVRHLMTVRVTTVEARSEVAELRRFMKDLRVRHLLVIQGEDQLIGIVSDRDVIQRCGETAADIMTKNPVTVTPATPAAQAISAMLNGGFSCVPVVEQGRLCGLLTTSDLMMALQCTLRLLLQQDEAIATDGTLDEPVRCRGSEIDEERVKGLKAATSSLGVSRETRCGY